MKIFHHRSEPSRALRAAKRLFPSDPARAGRAVPLLILSLLLAVLFLAGAVCAEEVDSGTCGQNLTWTLDDKGTLTISYTGSGSAEMARYNYDTIDYPWNKAYTVPITNVIIEEGVSSIGDSAFYDLFSIKSVSLPSSLKRIENHAFDHCFGLTSITIPTGTQMLGAQAFSGCSNLESVTFSGSGRINIGPWAFAYCDKLRSVIFSPDSTKSVTTPGSSSNDAFYYNENVIIYAPADVKFIQGQVPEIKRYYPLKVTNNKITAEGDQNSPLPAGYFYTGETITLTVSADFEFTSIEVTYKGESGTENIKPQQSIEDPLKYTFTMPGADAVVNLALNEYTISVTAKPAEGGTVTGAGTYDYGSPVTIQATPNNGYSFVNWTENGTQVSTDAAYTFKVKDDRNFVANFEPNEYTISVTAKPAEGGTVTGAGTYDYGSPVTIQATPNTGYSFKNWTENDTQVSTDAAYTFTVTKDRTLVANFEPDKYTISVTAKPAEGGTVTGGGTYSENTSVTVTATPNNGYKFVNWTENGTQVSTDAAYTFKVKDDRNFVANFEPNEYTITFLDEDGTELQSGKVPYGEKPAYTGKEPAKESTDEKVYAFAGWKPDITAVTGDAAYTAVYSDTEQKYPITFVDEDGTVLKEAVEYDFGTPAADIVKPADPVKAATASETFTFAGWTPEITDVKKAQTYTASYSSVEFKLETERKTLTKVPEELKGSYSSVEALKQYMQQQLKLIVEGESWQIEQTVFHDVELKISLDGGKTWKPATVDNFPEGGLEVTLPYPEGTGKDTHYFRVIHIFAVTNDRLGTKAGEAEYPEVSAEDDGLHVVLKGLSPVAVTMKAKETEEETEDFEVKVDFFFVKKDGSYCVPFDVKAETLKPVLTIKDGEKVLSTSKAIKVEIEPNAKDGGPDLTASFPKKLDLEPGKYTVSVSGLPKTIGLEIPDGDAKDAPKYSLTAKAEINLKDGKPVITVYLVFTPPAPKIEEPVVYPLPEDAIGAYWLRKDGTKEYLLFHTYDICMAWLGKDELCAGPERCFHKDGK